jgi:glycosyltransferase involved in cell wall biosynthesis
MKIALVTSWLSSFGGGVSAAVEGLSAALAGLPMQASVLGLEDEAWLRERPDWGGARARGFAVNGPRALGVSFSLRRALKALNPDIAHVHGIWMHTSADVVSWAGWRKPYIVSPHGMLDPWAVGNSAFKKRVARLLYEDRHLGGAACIHALCEAEAHAIRAFGLTNPVCIIPNGIKLPGSGPKPPAPWADKFREVGPVLLFLGRLHPKKNVHGLIEGLARIKANGGLGGWKLAIAGWDQDGYAGKLAGLVRQLELEEDAVFLGAVRGAAKDAALRNASAFVLPSVSEGLPMAILEAWAYGLPVAMTGACNLPEGFKAGAAHEIGAAPEDMPAGLAAFLSLSEAELTAMGQNGFNLARTSFSWEQVARQFKTVFEWRLGGGAAPDCVWAG